MGKLASLFIAFALSIGLFHDLRITGFPRIEDSNNLAPYMFLSSYAANRAVQLPANWHSRFVSCAITGAWCGLWGFPRQSVETPADVGVNHVIFILKDQIRFGDMMASFFALFYFLTCLALIGFLRNPVVPMVGTFACILTCSPHFWSPYLMPWDLPTMAVFTLIFLVYEKLKQIPPNQWQWLVFGLIIVLGGLLKETVLVTALFMFAAAWSRLKQFGSVAGIVVLSQLLNWTVSGAVPDWMFSVKGLDIPGESHWNPLSLWPALLANGGTLALMPWLLYKRRDWVLSAVCGAFIVLQSASFLHTGYYDELRDWLELAPIGWVLIGDAYTRSSPDPLVKKNG